MDFWGEDAISLFLIVAGLISAADLVLILKSKWT